MTQTSNGYSSLSVALHWIAGVAIIALFFTHEGDQGLASMTFHVSGGAILGVLLLWRIVRRMSRGFAEKPAQHEVLNLASGFVMWGLMITTLVVVITGYLLPSTLGNPLDIYGIITIPSFTGRLADLHVRLEWLHNLAGHAIVPLFLIHIIGSLKHLLIDRDNVMQRIFRPLKDGK